MMTTTRCAVLALALLAPPVALAGGTAADVMLKGKMSADAGDAAAAEKAFQEVASDASAPAPARAEALVRLGVVEGALGKTQASRESFRKAMGSPARDAQVTRLLALALTGVAPDETRWASEWLQVKLAAAASTATPEIAWPKAGRHHVCDAMPIRDLVTIDVEDFHLERFLFGFLVSGGERGLGGPEWVSWPRTYAAPAATRALDFVIHANVGGRITVKAKGRPWCSLLDDVLASHHLGFTFDDGLLFIAPVENLGSLDGVPHHKPADPKLPSIVWDEVPLFGKPAGVLDILSFANVKLVADPGIQGRLFLRLTNRPMPQLLDLMLASNGLAAARTPTPGELRVARRTDLGSAALTLQTDVPAEDFGRGTAPRNVEIGVWSVPLDANTGKTKGTAQKIDQESHSLGELLLWPLSADGRWLAFTARRGGKLRPWVRDLSTGAERPLIDNEGETTAMTADGSIAFYETEAPKEGHLTFSIPTAAGGKPTLVCHECRATGVSPDGRSVLVTQPDCRAGRACDIALLDLVSGKQTPILDNRGYALYRAHFSPDGHWIVFHAREASSDTKREYVAPFRGAVVVPVNEWVAIAERSDAPGWSPDGNLIYYLSDRDGSLCVWAQRLEPKTKKPTGQPFAVLHLHDAAHALKNLPPWQYDLSIAADELIYEQPEGAPPAVVGAGSRPQ